MYCKIRIHHLGWLIPLPTNLKPFALALVLPKLQFRFSGASSEQSSQDPCEWDAFASCHQWWHCQTAQECASSRCLKAGARFVSVMFCWLAIDFGGSFTIFATWWDSPDLYVPPVLEIAWESRMAENPGTGGAGVWQADRVWWHLPRGSMVRSRATISQ